MRQFVRQHGPFNHFETRKLIFMLFKLKIAAHSRQTSAELTPTLQLHKHWIIYSKQCCDRLSRHAAPRSTSHLISLRLLNKKNNGGTEFISPVFIYENFVNSLLYSRHKLVFDLRGRTWLSKIYTDIYVRTRGSPIFIAFYFMRMFHLARKH